MRIMIKGGVWKNTEDEILKAAVMKYGKNQWARISSLLVRKSAKQCKARWYEWLDPSIKKTEWTREEDEKLLHLAKLMPTQWRTIAPIVGRTPSQCLERYEKLLDAACAKDDNYEPGDDPRKLRPGEIDPNPESKPARPDPVDMDEDEKEMLSEARARLANTRGKKAKRKAREKQLEEARRLATLQKKRELKAAGINNKQRKRKRRGIDYNAEIPFEKKPPAGFFDVTDEARPVEQPKFPTTIEELEGKRRVDVEAQLRKQDVAKNKIAQRQDAPSAILQANKLNDPETVRKRSKLMLPPPQISDHELEEISKMGYATDFVEGSEELTEGSAATRHLLANYSQTPLHGRTPLRTPQRTPSGKGDAIMMEAENLARLRESQTPLLGGDNPELHPSDFSGVTPKKREIQTPNLMLTPSATPGGLTPGGMGLTPRIGMTPSKDGYSLGMTPKGTPLRDGLHIMQESAKLEQRSIADFRRNLSNLPQPKNEYQLVVQSATDDTEEPEEKIEEDMSDRIARERAEEEARQQALLRKRSKVLQRELPRPPVASLELIRSSLMRAVESMERRRFNRDSTRESMKMEQVPDLTDFMNDMFFGAVKAADQKAYNLMSEDFRDEEDDSSDMESPRMSVTTSKLTQDWLEEAKRMVAASPSRGCDSPSRLVGSPRFAVATQNRASALLADRRDPLSRSARRHRTVESFSGEILLKSAKHSRNKSDTPNTATTTTTPVDISPASAVHKWFSNILKPSTPTPPPLSSNAAPTQDTIPDPPAKNLPPRLPVHRKSRFQKDPSATQPQPIPTRRTFKAPAPLPDTAVLSPPKNLIDSSHRRTASSSTCSLPDNHVLSPPRNLVESANRRSISSSTCSFETISSRKDENGRVKDGDGGRDLNGFLREQRIKIGKILNGEVSAKAKIVLSGPSNSTSSMVAAICFAWLLENRIRNGKEGIGGEGSVVVPVMNARRGKMWKQRQAAWLFHHVGVDATVLLFAEEVDLESLMMAKQLSMVVVGQDILRTDSEVGSLCTILTDNYCEDAYDLLQSPVLKKLLLAGILLDTQNLFASAKLSMTRDAEALQLLLVGSAPNYRYALFDQLMQDQKDTSFLEAFQRNYGKPPSESINDTGTMVEYKPPVSHPEPTVQNLDKNTNGLRNAKLKTAKPAPAQVASGGKNKFSLGKWFGFGSKG